mmetsp:Transcript_19480/g.49510  ORF Transcript_19480/g.49510 Transcript_19480/m.49510 type:complete len:294 (-) Transcript_19480:642-1523(-)
MVECALGGAAAAPVLGAQPRGVRDPVARLDACCGLGRGGGVEHDEAGVLELQRHVGALRRAHERGEVRHVVDGVAVHLVYHQPVKSFVASVRLVLQHLREDHHLPPQLVERAVQRLLHQPARRVVVPVIRPPVVQHRLHQRREDEACVHVVLGQFPVLVDRHQQLLRGRHDHELRLHARPQHAQADQVADRLGGHQVVEVDTLSRPPLDGAVVGDGHPVHCHHDVALLQYARRRADGEHVVDHHAALVGAHSQVRAQRHVLERLQPHAQLAKADVAPVPLKVLEKVPHDRRGY